jgi:transposase
VRARIPSSGTLATQIIRRKPLDLSRAESSYRRLEAMNAVRCVLRTGCQWRQLPKDFPPHSTVYSYFWEWSRYGLLDRIHHTLLVAAVKPKAGKLRPRCGQESQRHQAQRARQYDRIAAWHRRDPGQRSGPERRREACQKDPPLVPFRPPRLCGWRLRLQSKRVPSVVGGEESGLRKLVLGLKRRLFQCAVNPDIFGAGD